MKKRKQISYGQESDSKTEELMKYLNQQLSSDKEWELERALQSSPILRDAEEGLQMLSNKEALPNIVQGLNQKLKHKIKKKSSRQDKTPGLNLILLSTLLLLLLIILVCFFIYYKSAP